MTKPPLRPMHFVHFATAIIAAVLVATSPCAPLTAQEDDDDELRLGLVGGYKSDRGELARVDRTLAFHWGGDLPDARLREGPFEVVWRGYLMSQTKGDYRLHAFAQGQVEVTLAGKKMIHKGALTPQWLESEALNLEFDWHPIEIRFQQTAATAQFALYWSGPKFAIEPISARFLFHEPDESPRELFEEGREIVHAFRCGACHQLDDSVIAGPSLTALRGNLRRPWLVDRLSQHAAAAATDASRRMPDFDLSAEQAGQIADFLLSKQPRPRSPAAKKQSGKQPKGKKEKLLPAAAHRGEQTFLTVGCLACHHRGELGRSGLYGGGDLTKIAAKRPPAFFSNWLLDPTALNAHRRMPVFELSEQERIDLAAYLSDGGRELKAPPAANNPSARAGEKLVADLRCAACHEITGVKRPTRLPLKSNRGGDCLSGPDKLRPGYRFDRASAGAVREFLAAAQHLDALNDHTARARMLRERNCLACHANGVSSGLAPQLNEVVRSHPQLAAQQPAMKPPSLISVGDKLFDAALRETIRRQAVHRPWLAVRMPKFDLADEQVDELVSHFVEQDRIPDHRTKPRPPTPRVNLDAASGRLVTPDGFGCTSCHQVGKVQPPKAPLNAKGPDLAQLGKRIRYSWFDRWVRNPIRIVPRMEMPSVQIPVQGVLDNRLDDQLAAVWLALNDPGFRPPEPNAVRVVRRRNQVDAGESAAVLTDVIQFNDKQWIKPLLVGLPNRHNVLFDLETGRLSGWWIGDTARQRTKGKTWFWEAGGKDLLGQELGPEVRIRIGGKDFEPHVAGQFITEPDSWRHNHGQLTEQHRLHLALPDGERAVRVKQQLTPIWAKAGASLSGWRRRLEFDGAPADAEVLVRIAQSERATIDVRNRRVVIDEENSLEVRAARGKLQSDGVVVAETQGDAQVVELMYLAGISVDQFLNKPPPRPETRVVPLKVTPGFDAQRLPLVNDIMPTALAWRPDGVLAVASLKGRVWLALDTDGDGLEDQMAQFGDELAAPFGIHARSNKVLDVATKYGVARLTDDDGDGRAEQTQLVASGWGHTADYHDWAIGLPPDGDGGYYLSLACQQDKRSQAAARLRGTVVRLHPRTPTDDDPRLFETKLVSGGHRFPVGIARNRSGQLFVSDNQGNFNPFNELNHVRPGLRFGFINAAERDPGFNPPLTEPAINIPHPWTRSVNGICFLETPDALRRGEQVSVFGPFEGHLIGCEYDSRRLIRMSLQGVRGQLQGASYPFSLYHPQDGQTFLGPLTCAVSPRGDLYIGSIRDSGWGGANNIGTIVRLRPQLKHMPAGIAEVKAIGDGFEVSFTRPVDRQLGGDANNYSVISYTRISTPAYGGPDKDRRTERIENVALSADGLRATVTLTKWREGFVYEIRAKSLTKSGSLFHPAEAFYSLNKAP